MILLTEATGAAGSFIANEFVEHRVPVRILVRDRAKAKRVENIPTVEIVAGDMSRRGSLTRALNGVDRALMISAPSMDMVQTQAHFYRRQQGRWAPERTDAPQQTTFPFDHLVGELATEARLGKGLY